MDLQTFITAHAPAACQSRLAPLLSNLQELRRLGYTFAQLAEFAALMGVRTTRSNVAAYLGRCAPEDVDDGDRRPDRHRADDQRHAAPSSAPARAAAPSAPITTITTRTGGQPAPAGLPPAHSAVQPARVGGGLAAVAAPRRSIREIRDQSRNLTDLSERYRAHLVQRRAARK